MRKISRRARPHTITLFNYVSTTAGIATYQRTVIQRVYLDEDYQQRLSQRGVATTDKAQLIIDLRDIEVTADRTFIEPEDWLLLTSQQKALYFTFQVANDFFIDSTVTDTLPPLTKAEMQKTHRCLSVTSTGIPASDRAGPALLEVTAK
jgi:hypothetical protein